MRAFPLSFLTLRFKAKLTDASLKGLGYIPPHSHLAIFSQSSSLRVDFLSRAEADK